MENVPGRLATILAVCLLALSAACGSPPVPTPTPVPPPTQAPPQVQHLVPAPTLTPVPPTPAPARLAAVAALLDQWGLGDPAAAAGAKRQVMSATDAGDVTAYALQDAPVLTPTAGVQIEPALLVQPAGSPTGTLAYAVSAAGNLIVPYMVVWGEHAGAATILYTWSVGGTRQALLPLVVLDPAERRQGPVYWTIDAALPVWSPDGSACAFVDAGPDGPRMALIDGAGVVRATGPASNLECANCWPDGAWAPVGDRWAYTTAAEAGAATPSPFGHLTWRLVVLDTAQTTPRFSQTGAPGEVAQIAGWPDANRLQVVVRRPTIPATAITGQSGAWVDTSYILRLDATNPQLEPQMP